MCETLANHDMLWQPSSRIVLSLDHQVCFLMNIFGKRSDLPFSRKSDHAWFRLRMSRILFAAKHSWTTLRMSRPLFVGSYLQVTWNDTELCLFCGNGFPPGIMQMANNEIGASGTRACISFCSDYSGCN